MDPFSLIAGVLAVAVSLTGTATTFTDLWEAEDERDPEALFTDQQQEADNIFGETPGDLANAIGGAESRGEISGVTPS